MAREMGADVGFGRAEEGTDDLDRAGAGRSTLTGSGRSTLAGSSGLVGGLAGRDRSHPWGEDGEAAGTGAAKQAHEHGFGAIFGVMGGGDDRRDGRRAPRRSRRRRGVGRIGQRLPPRVARARLEIAAPRHVDARSAELDAIRRCETLRQIELSRSFGAKAVIDAMGGDGQAQLRAESNEDGEEGHRVGPTAHRDEDTGAGLEAALSFEGATRDREERRSAAGREIA